MGGNDHDEGPGTWCQPRKLERGWLLWTGAEWAEIQSLWLGEEVFISVADGRVFRCRYTDAVRCRAGAPKPLTLAALRHIRVFPGLRLGCALRSRGLRRHPPGSSRR